MRRTDFSVRVVVATVVGCWGPRDRPRRVPLLAATQAAARTRVVALAAFFALAAGARLEAQVRLHVDPSMAASGDGLSWQTAFKGIKSAVDAANANPAVAEIWIKKGTYYPGTTPYRSRNGLALYGGFAGTETDLSQRSLALNETVLTGQDSVRVINGAGLDATAVFDGFTIRDGRTNDSGALVVDGSATFRRCKFLSSRAGAAGGAYSSYGDSPTFVECRFNGCESGGDGAAVSSYEGSLTFVNCRVFANVADGSWAISTYEGDITLINTAVCGNTGAGGGGVSTYRGALVAVGSTIASNSGAGLTSSSTGPAKILDNCVIWANSLEGPVEARFSCLPAVYPGDGNISDDPAFADAANRDWRLGMGAGAIDAASAALLPADDFDADFDGDTAEPFPVDNNGFVRVRAAGDGKPRLDMGAYEWFADCNTNFIEDSADIAGGASADLNANGLPDECEDCNGNSLPDSIDIASGFSEDCQRDGLPDECQQDLEIVRYKLDDGGIDTEIGLSNAADIAWLNRFVVAEGGEVLRDLRFAWGSGLTNGQGLDIYVWSDPDQDGSPADARVLYTQLVFIAGVGTGALQTIDIPDLFIGAEGRSFFVGAIVPGTTGIVPIDLGAPSSQSSWVVASDAPGTLDPNDLAAWPLFGLVDTFGFPGDWLVRATAWRELDCNGNGELDECDLFAGTSVDCGGDGIPDECQLAGNDCNGNGVPDDCELASGALSDCQPDGVPDQCELASGASTDLNGNGLPDDCEDCDGNGLPDSIDLAAGAVDCQPDGVLDICQLDTGEEVVYRRDDGTAEIYVSSDAPNMAWLVHYAVEPGGERIGAIDILHARMPFGFPVDVYLWSDPNGDGNPSDARVLAHVATTIESPDSNTFERVELPDVLVGEPGTSFFVGAVVHRFTLQVDYPGAKHNAGATFTSWLVGKNGTIDPNDLSLDADEFLRIDDLGGPFVGTWCVRAVADATNDCNANGIPDDCDILDGTSADIDRDGRPDECYPPAGCGSDLTGDGVVGAEDLAALLLAWGGTGAADLDGDGSVGASDLAQLLLDWGGC